MNNLMIMSRVLYHCSTSTKHFILNHIFHHFLSLVVSGKIRTNDLEIMSQGFYHRATSPSRPFFQITFFTFFSLTLSVARFEPPILRLRDKFSTTVLPILGILSQITLLSLSRCKRQDLNNLMIMCRVLHNCATSTRHCI